MKYNSFGYNLIRIINVTRSHRFKSKDKYKFQKGNVIQRNTYKFPKLNNTVQYLPCHTLYCAYAYARFRMMSITTKLCIMKLHFD